MTIQDQLTFSIQKRVLGDDFQTGYNPSTQPALEISPKNGFDENDLLVTLYLGSSLIHSNPHQNLDQVYLTEGGRLYVENKENEFNQIPFGNFEALNLLLELGGRKPDAEDVYNKIVLQLHEEMDGNNEVYRKAREQRDLALAGLDESGEEEALREFNETEDWYFQSLKEVSNFFITLQKILLAIELMVNY